MARSTAFKNGIAALAVIATILGGLTLAIVASFYQQRQLARRFRDGRLLKRRLPGPIKP